ncbi:MAG: S-ribosylhomocysteine lyase, partial [Clostridiales bacterium]
GCYLLTRDNISQEQIKELLLETMSFIASYQGAIPGTSPQECGNYLDMDLPAAQEEAEKYRQVLIARQGSNLAY